MSLQFQLAYLFGYAPWDRWRGKPLRRLRELFEGPQALRPGRVLDLGCGMGRATIYLAQQGWKATGVDAVERALRVARRRAARIRRKCRIRARRCYASRSRGGDWPIRSLSRPGLFSYFIGAGAPLIQREYHTSCHCGCTTYPICVWSQQARPGTSRRRARGHRTKLFTRLDYRLECP